VDTPVIELDNVVKNYYLGPVTVPALKGISLKINEGELISIIGTSGCGKTTLMNILGLLDRPTSGEYRIEGRTIAECSDNELSTLRNKNIGFVFQQYNLLARLDVLQNVYVPLQYRGMTKADMQARSREMLKLVSMEDREHHKPNELSGGQQQRVAIARALVGTPNLILADEPTGALDVKTSDDIMNLFIRLNKESGITVVIITHSPDIAKRCPRIVSLSDGFIINDTKK